MTRGEAGRVEAALRVLLESPRLRVEVSRTRGAPVEVAIGSHMVGTIEPDPDGDGSYHVNIVLLGEDL